MQRFVNNWSTTLLAPLLAGDSELSVSAAMAAKVAACLQDPGDYLDKVDRSGAAVNVGMLAGHEYFSLSQEELLQRFLPSLQKFNPDFKPDWVRKTWLFKAQYAQPIPQLNHSQNIPALRTPIDGLYFASMSQVYPWDRGTNFAVQVARKAARLMLEKA